MSRTSTQGNKGKKAASQKNERKIALVFLLLIPLLISTGCAKTHKKTETARGTKIEKKRSDSGVKKEIMRPEQKEYASIQSPQRTASQQIVSKGKVYINQKNFETALHTFQEAITVDSTNGIAYYYLALAHYYLRQFDQSLGVLDKAESLLSGSNEWIETVGELRIKIQDELARQ